MEPRVDCGLLGPLQVSVDSLGIVVSAPRQRVLLATLLLKAGRVVSVEGLAEYLWDGRPPPSSRSAVQSAVQRLRSVIGARGHDLIRTRPPGYLIEVDQSGLDVTRFEVLAEQGHAAAEAQQWDVAARTLREALRLWRGDVLADVPSGSLRQHYGAPLEEQRMRALTMRIDADLHLGRHEKLIGELTGLVADNPLRERFHGQYMLALYRAGRQADALAAYQRVRHVLAEELAAEPGAELQRLHHDILRAGVHLTAARGPGGSVATPVDVRGQATPPGSDPTQPPPPELDARTSKRRRSSLWLRIGALATALAVLGGLGYAALNAGTSSSEDTGSATGPGPSAPGLPAPGEYRVRLTHSGLCLNERQHEPSGLVYQASCAQPMPKRNLRPAGNHTFRIITDHPDFGPGCTSLPLGSPGPGAQVFDDYCGDDKATEFRVEPVTAPTAGFRLRAVHSGLCLGVPDGSIREWAPVIQLPCDDLAAAQVFEFDPPG